MILYRANMVWRSFAVLVLGLTALSCSPSAALLGIERLQEAAEVESLKADLAICLGGPGADTPTLVTVWVEPESTTQEIEAVEEAIASTKGVTSYDFVDADESYAEFVEFFADDPDVVDQVGPESIPMSFQVSVSRLDQAEALVERVSLASVVQSADTETSRAECHNEVDALAKACGTNQEDLHDAAVWLKPAIDQNEVDRIKRQLEDIKRVVAVRYVDQEETLTEFREFFADDPDVSDLVDLVDADGLPTRFEISVQPVSPDGIATLRTELESLSRDVSSVEVALAAISCLQPTELGTSN